MPEKKNILAIIGSANENSANLKLVEYIASLTKDIFKIKIYNNLKALPHFDPDLSIEHPPALIVELREAVSVADGIIICTPEYVFSIPSGLKNAIEWCVATTVFSHKPMGLITASASGQKAHEELKLIMKTLMSEFTEPTTLLIQGIKGKIDEMGKLTDRQTMEEVNKFIDAFKILLNNSCP
jgi:chromate reductase, NAD(P)H dehydrogenase (quinone)